MTHRIIVDARPDQTGNQEDSPHPTGRSTLVIADSGAVAEVLVFPSREPVGPGTHFRYRGAVWEITGKRDSGILVAEPSRH